jgi:hypothetical protein
MAQFNFDTNSVEKRENSYELLPAGWYTAQVTESEIVKLNSGNGSALKLTIEVLQDGYRGRKVWARLNVQHSNPKAEQIAQQQLRELCDSIGVVRMQDTVELHNKPVSVKVKIRKDDTGNYEDQNEVVGFKPAGAGNSAMQVTPGGTFPVPQRAAAPAAAAPVATAGAASPPWAKKAA